MRKLTLQITDQRPKVAYAASGTMISACIVDEPRTIVEHGAYWCNFATLDEARYLCAIINSQYVLDTIMPMQAHGWRDPRHFDKLIWELPIPAFDRKNRIHAELAAASFEAELIAQQVRLPEGHFTRKRRAIREALIGTGVAPRIEELVAELISA